MSTQAQQTPNTLIAACLLVITAIILSAALAYTRVIMVPFVFSLFLSYFVSPIVSFFQKKVRLPHWLAVIAALLCVFLFVTIFVLVLRDSILRMIEGFSQYEEKLSRVSEQATALFQRLNVPMDQTTILSKIKDLPIFSFLQGAAESVMSFLLNCILVVVFLIFLISGKSSAPRKSDLGQMIDSKIRSYILTKIATSLLTAIMVWIVYAIFRLDLAIMFGMLCFILNFIPTLGCIVATLLPLPIALIQYEEPFPILAIILIPAFLQLSVGNLVEPKLLGKGLDLHPITILISLMFWGLIWGVAGMFLAVPITASLKIILDKYTLTERFSQMLAGKSPFA